MATERPPAQPCDALVELCGGGSGHVFPLVFSRIAIGRDASRCPIHIDDPSLAGLHAEFLQESDGSWRIIASAAVPVCDSLSGRGIRCAAAAAQRECTPGCEIGQRAAVAGLLFDLFALAVEPQILNAPHLMEV